tara:strand:+ start:885 stop:1208 length:324 start_codon:yes stop_codon:yes gene_type:complete
MKFTKLIILFSSLTIILNSCTTIADAGKVLRNDKSSSSADEFLIKNKEPLTLPPNFYEIPEPGSSEKNAELKSNRFEKILRNNQSTPDSNQTKSSSTEESILNQIKK